MTDTLERGKRIAKEIGLDMSTHSPAYNGAMGGVCDWYSADSIHELLGKSVEIFGNKNCRHWDDNAPPRTDIGAGVTHQALLIAIRPIKPKDDAESLLREYMASFDDNHRGNFSEWVGRAKAYLESKGE